MYITDLEIETVSQNVTRKSGIFIVKTIQWLHDNVHYVLQTFTDDLIVTLYYNCKELLSASSQVF